MTLGDFLWVVNGIGCILFFIGGYFFNKKPIAAVVAFAVGGVFLLLSLDISKGFWINLGIGA